MACSRGWAQVPCIPQIAWLTRLDSNLLDEQVGGQWIDLDRPRTVVVGSLMTGGRPRLPRLCLGYCIVVLVDFATRHDDDRSEELDTLGERLKLLARLQENTSCLPRSYNRMMQF